MVYCASCFAGGSLSAKILRNASCVKSFFVIYLHYKYHPWMRAVKHVGINQEEHSSYLTEPYFIPACFAMESILPISRGGGVLSSAVRVNIWQPLGMYST